MIRDEGVILLLGAGRMGGAMLERWTDTATDPKTIIVIDPAPPPSRQRWMDEREIAFFPSLSSLPGSSDDAPPAFLVLAVKPSQVAESVEAARSHIGEATLVFSIAAGVPLAAFLSPLPRGQIGIRAMPNSPARLGYGATALFPSAPLTADQKRAAEGLASPLGAVFWLKEEAAMDGVTALSGSGPAYLFHLAECMRDAGAALGLEKALAEQLARQTILGAGAMLSETEESPEALREAVSSPGGTTEAALRLLMKDEALARLMRQAMTAAWKKAREIGT